MCNISGVSRSGYYKYDSINEVLSYNVSKNLKIDIVTKTIDKLIENSIYILRKDSFIHSDQSVNYTSSIFQNKVKENKLGQFMARRGNCLDNVPQESFLRHLRYEIDIKECETFEDLVKEIDDYIDYYNNFRGQWN